MTYKTNGHPLINYILAWGVHAFTASATFIGVLTLMQIYHHKFTHALWLMGATVAIDALDGTLARMVKVEKYTPTIDGALLDNIVDFLNYVVTPCFFLVVKQDMLPTSLAIWVIIGISITSSYQFCQTDAKTPDHFFKGFPCYWNFAVFYMYIFSTSMTVNAVILMILCVLIFVPIKYVYPSRIDYLTNSKHLKILMHCCSALYGFSSILILLRFPEKEPLWLSISFGYVLLYLFISFYRTCSPLIMAKLHAIKD